MAHPSLLAGPRVDRVSIVQSGHIQGVADDDGVGLKARRLRNLEPSHLPEGADIVRVDLRKRRKSCGVVTAIKLRPLAARSLSVALANAFRSQSERETCKCHKDEAVTDSAHRRLGSS